MIRALTPRLAGGFSWAPAAVLGLHLGGYAHAQEGRPAAPKADTPAAAAKADDSPEPAGPGSKVERFVDPKAKPALEIFKPQNYTGPQLRTSGPGNVATRLQNMAARLENEDPALIKNYIDFYAAELTKRDNINALINPPASMKPDSPQARGLEKAVDALTRPIIDARANDNTTFLTNYARALFDSQLPKLMNDNYLTRIDAMIVLGMAGGTSSNALEFYAAQLKNPDQVIWVKMWAANGYTNAAKSGRANLDATRALYGADAVVTFLNSDPKLPYFAQFRALEALGSIRVATINRPELNLDVASVIAGYLVDPAARLSTRSWAAWALGMLRVPSQISAYNYALAGYEVGDLAADLGAKIVAEYDEHAATFDRDKDRATSLTANLMFQVVPAVAGEEAISDSGLLRSNHPNAANAKSFLGKLDEKIKALSREAYELIRAGGTSQKGKRDDLNAKVADLRTFLDQNQPKDRHLVPTGPVLPVAEPKVAAKPDAR